MTQTNLPKKQRQTRRHREQTWAAQGAGVRRREWEFGVKRGGRFYARQISNEALLCSPGDCTRLPGTNRDGEDRKKRPIHV